MGEQGTDYSSDNCNSEGDHLPSVLSLNNKQLDTTRLEEYLEEIVVNEPENVRKIEVLKATNNLLRSVPKNINHFTSLRKLDISDNRITYLPDVFKHLPLTSLIARGNLLTNNSLPKVFTSSKWVREINFTSNLFTGFPEQILVFKNLRYLYLGSNKICSVPNAISKLTNLRLLHIYNNLVESIPESIANLKHLKALRLHDNNLKTLPRDIVTLDNLLYLSLRDNPLVNRFISDMTHQPTSLMELSARAVKLFNIPVQEGEIPATLSEYLSTAHRCVNPRCRGVFFNKRVEHVKFVDFCGKYKIPLLQYLCSSKCIEGEENGLELTSNSDMMRKVLLG
ncbi:leucine-rich repeat-containing protein 58 [Onthophagus taurus]|uniref:leucine-rich repeat-containing protein 58 n=1 Tax=Onthophagus taurus TaxID=166361 RepID=UPI000C203AD6|nr:leucine-rich repeat-containing protein 58 isoform X1 [Onthophagus taurus]XP_022914578.1 leucine-rich repeat-containing protein 58 isoform X1 [Onthophagus taurus]XP_022914579.1 leucine-rich repeat-containing protein 58 isoform X2 [Onthophagus taurus]